MLKRLVGFLVVLSLVFLPLSCGGEEEPVGKPGSDDGSDEGPGNGSGDGLTGDENPFAGQLLVHDFMWNRTDAQLYSFHSISSSAFYKFVSSHENWNMAGFAVVEDAEVVSPGASYEKVDQLKGSFSFADYAYDGVGKYRYSDYSYISLEGKKYSSVDYNDIEFSGKFTTVFREPLNYDHVSVNPYRAGTDVTLQNTDVLDEEDKTKWYGWNPVRRMSSETVSFKFPFGWNKRYVIPPQYFDSNYGSLFLEAGISGKIKRYSGFMDYDILMWGKEEGKFTSDMYKAEWEPKLGYLQLLSALPDGKHLLHSVETVVGVEKSGDEALASSFGSDMEFYYNLYLGPSDKVNPNYYGIAYGSGSAQRYLEYSDKVKKFVGSVSVGDKVFLDKTDTLQVSFSESVPEGVKVYVGLLMGHLPPGSSKLDGDIENFTVGYFGSSDDGLSSHYYTTFMAQDLKDYSGSPLSFSVSGLVGSFEEKVKADFFADSQKYIPDFEKNSAIGPGPGQQDGVWDGVSYVYDLDKYYAETRYWSDFVYTEEDWRSEKFPLRVMVYLLKDE
jgi:hypothetical protein